MLVKDLIKKLKQLNQDAELNMVVCDSYDNVGIDIIHLEEIDLDSGMLKDGGNLVELIYQLPENMIIEIIKD